MAEDRTGLIREFFDTVWSRGRAQEAERFFAGDAEACGFLPDLALTPGDFETFAAMVQMQVADIDAEIAHVVESGDWIAAMVVFTGKVVRTGQPLRVAGQVMMEIRDGRIHSAFNNFDMISLFVQIGVLPPEVVERALGGDTAIC